MTIPAGGYPKQPFGTDPQTGRLVNLVYPAGDAKQFRYIVFNNVADEAAYSGNGVPASGITSVQETKHSR
jgi:hypothetical protein